MVNIGHIISGDFSAYPEESQEFMKKYTEKLRENIKDELIKDIANRMLKDIDKSKEYFMNVLTEILDNGYKGLERMPTTMLLDKYLEGKSQEDFMKLLEKVNEEVE